MPEPEIKRLMIQHGVIARIKARIWEKREINRRDARSVPRGASIMCNYFDEAGTYAATSHQLVDAAGQVIHCDVKRFIAGDNDYRIPKNIPAAPA
ncbi:MAG: hypothetical protein HY673_14760 [Chloroflexi bacterium]|nr:hypothetical protein [Chloroflexota bacterium]